MYSIQLSSFKGVVAKVYFFYSAESELSTSRGEYLHEIEAKYEIRYFKYLKKI